MASGFKKRYHPHHAGISNVLLAAGVRVSEEEMYTSIVNSSTRFTGVMSYSHTAHVLLYPDEDFLTQVRT